MIRAIGSVLSQLAFTIVSVGVIALYAYAMCVLFVSFMGLLP